MYELWRDNLRSGHQADRDMYNAMCTRIARTAALERLRTMQDPTFATYCTLTRAWGAWFVAAPRCFPHLVGVRTVSRIRYLQQLRSGTSSLNAHHPTLPRAPCTCGPQDQRETPRHFLLHCTHYDRLRRHHDPLLAAAWRHLRTALHLPTTWQSVTDDDDVLLPVLLGNPPAPLAARPHSAQRDALETGNSSGAWRGWILTLSDAIDAMFRARSRRPPTADQQPPPSAPA
jgi:hypothetical protein